MSTESPTVLVIDDDADIVKTAGLLLKRRDIRVIGAIDPDDAWVRLAEQPVDVILLDLNFARGRTSGEEGFVMLDRLIAADRDAVVVVVTGHSGINIAVKAMREGASDFVIKPWNNERLVATVERALALRKARIGTAATLPAADDRTLLGEHPAIIKARAMIDRVAATDAAVLVRGPAGSGKSLVARSLHHGSNRADAPLIILACARLAEPGDMLTPIGAARGATLLLDEIGALPAALQPVLAEAIKDCRIIATSRQDRASLRGALDEDLLYRINTIEIDLPPLRGRGEDIARLARHFLDLFARRHGKPAKPLSDEAMRSIAQDHWPDDVRGLRQAMERAVLLGTTEVHDIADFALEIAPEAPMTRALAVDLNLTRSEQMLIEAALKRHAYNVSRAASDLGLTRAALYRRMAKYEL